MGGKKEPLRLNKFRAVSINNRTKDKVENVIQKIIENGIRESYEVKYILAWKLGIIDMKNSSENNFQYLSSWEDWGDNQEIKDRVSVLRSKKGGINLKALCDYIISNEEINLKKLKLKSCNDDDVKRIMEEFADCKLDGKSENDIEKCAFEQIGLVYMITLLHFMTCGGIPIYDRFAHIALKALYLGKEPGSYIYYAGPDCQYKTYLALMEEYIWLIDETVGKAGIS